MSATFSVAGVPTIPVKPKETVAGLPVSRTHACGPKTVCVPLTSFDGEFLGMSAPEGVAGEVASRQVTAANARIAMMEVRLTIGHSTNTVA